MPASAADAERPLPWVLRVTAPGGRFATAATGAGIAAAVVAAWLVYARASGWDLAGADRTIGWDLAGRARVVYELLFAALLGYVPVAAAFSLRGAAQDLRALRPVLACGPGELEAEVAAVERPGRRGMWTAGGLGAALGLYLVLGVPWLRDAGIDLAHPSLPWIAVRSVAVCGVVLQALYLEAHTARRFARVAGRWLRVDLHRPETLAPFSRRGLRSVFLLMVLSGLLAALQIFAPGPVEGAAEGAVGVVVVALAALVAPVVGIHRSMAAARDGELARVREAIRAASGRLGPGRAEGAGPPLQDLVAYHGYVESRPVWPFDLSALLRFGLYVLLGLGSWLGAALVERALERVMG